LTPICDSLPSRSGGALCSTGCEAPVVCGENGGTGGAGSGPGNALWRSERSGVAGERRFGRYPLGHGMATRSPDADSFHADCGCLCSEWSVFPDFAAVCYSGCCRSVPTRLVGISVLVNQRRNRCAMTLFACGFSHPRASYFLLRRQKKVAQEKAARLPLAPCAPRFQPGSPEGASRPLCRRAESLPRP